MVEPVGTPAEKGKGDDIMVRCKVNENGFRRMEVLAGFGEVGYCEVCHYDTALLEDGSYRHFTSTSQWAAAIERERKMTTWN